jgi:serine protease Do
MLPQPAGQVEGVYTCRERTGAACRSKEKGIEMNDTKKLNGWRRKLAYAAPIVFLGGAALVGSLVWAANPGEKHAARQDLPAPKLLISEQPLHREQGMAASFAPVVKKVSPSVVRVATLVKAHLAAQSGTPPGMPMPEMPFFRRFFGDQFQGEFGSGPMRVPPQRGEGSGVIISKDGYLLTNNHVVENADEVKVFLHDGREFIAKVVGKDPKSDLAVIKVEAANLPSIEIADSEKVEVGDVVLAIGNPFGIGQTVTMGMVSAKGRAPFGLDYEDFIQTDAAINPGNSGGALVDIEGRLIGINTAILSRSGGNQGIGFAIPANLARQVMVSLVKFGHVIRGYLGVTIQDVTPALAKEFKLKEHDGALVAEVMPHSPAQRAGFANGDVVLEFNGKKVTDSRHLKLEVAEAKPGETVSVKILRDNSPKTLEVKIGELPGTEHLVKASHEVPARGEALQGVGVSDLTSLYRREHHVPETIQGAFITSVEPDSAAAAAGLKSGDVIIEINRQQVKNAAEAVQFTENPKDRLTLLRVWSQGGIHYVLVDETGDKGA